MTDVQDKQLFDACANAFSRSVPPFDRAGVRRRVLEAHAKQRPPRVMRVSYRLALGGFVLALTALIFALRASSPTSFQVAGRDGQVGSWLVSQPTLPLSLTFSEGTQVSLGTGSRGRVTRVTAAGARIELESGSVNARVSHRPGAEWSFGAGPFDVAVIGTNLDVSWAPEAGKFELRVSQGAVLVRGTLIQGPQEVRAGQVCRVDVTRGLMELGRLAATASQSSASGGQEAAANAGLAPLPLPSPPPSQSSAPLVSPDVPAAWLPLARSGKHRDAVAAAERSGLANIYAGVPAEQLLELAGAARLAGRPELERAALLACRKRAPGRPAAAQAAYLLGRASAPARAAEWFETYLREEPRGLLAREASGRLIESYTAAGNRDAAKKAASRYLAAYPNGPHAVMARQALDARRESRD